MAAGAPSDEGLESAPLFAPAGIMRPWRKKQWQIDVFPAGFSGVNDQPLARSFLARLAAKNRFGAGNTWSVMRRPMSDAGNRPRGTREVLQFNQITRKPDVGVVTALGSLNPLPSPERGTVPWPV